jgi:hypothetical protein
MPYTRHRGPNRRVGRSLIALGASTDRIDGDDVVAIRHDIREPGIRAGQHRTRLLQAPEATYFSVEEGISGTSRWIHRRTTSIPIWGELSHLRQVANDEVFRHHRDDGLRFHSQLVSGTPYPVVMSESLAWTWKPALRHAPRAGVRTFAHQTRSLSMASTDGAIALSISLIGALPPIGWTLNISPPPIWALNFDGTI